MFNFIVEGILLVAIGLFGIIGNIWGIAVFSKTQKCFHNLMLALAIFDLLYILATVLLFGLPAIYPE